MSVFQNTQDIDAYATSGVLGCPSFGYGQPGYKVRAEGDFIIAVIAQRVVSSL